MIEKSNLQNVRDAFQSILRADYVAISDIGALKKMDSYYVDLLNNVPKILQYQDSFICGRRGTGKTTLLMKSYYECLKTISPLVKDRSSILNQKKVLPLYIDLSKCKDIFVESDEYSIERSFILKVLDELKTQLNDVFEKSCFNFLKKNMSESGIMEEIFDAIINGGLVKREIKDFTIENTSLLEVDMNGSLALDSVGVGAEKKQNRMDTKKYTIREDRGVTAQSLLSGLGRVRKEWSLDAIYVFIDEYSDLNPDEQIRFSILFKKLLGSKNNIFFKVGTITDRYNFGDSIIIGRDIFPISLDLCDFVERYGGIVSATKQLQLFTSQLIEIRLENYGSSDRVKDIFADNYKSMIERITFEAMGVPRTIGLILQNALTQAEIRENVVIQMSDINMGIRETRRVYFKQFQGAIQKRILPGFYMDMWNSLLQRALLEKKNRPQRPASHFMLDPVRRKYLNVLSENFIVHCLEESRASKYGGNYVLFAIDYDICNENNIIYATDKDEFTAVRFVYDKTFQDFDCYFSKDCIRSYKCPDCHKIYEETEVHNAKVKRCFECDTILEEIIHQEVPKTNGNYTEIEIKILGLIATLDEDEAMSASQISDIVGCNYQKVGALCGKNLRKKGLINVKEHNGKNLYYNKE